MARRGWLARAILDHSLLLPAGALVALIWANTFSASYTALAHRLEFVVNDIGMVFFFALAAKEVVEATVPGGSLHTWRRAAMPVVAAIGGMAGPALIYLAIVVLSRQPALARGWAIPCATDIAFSYLVAKVIYRRHPAVPFLVLLAIADDAFGLIILAVFYPTGDLRPLSGVMLLGAALCVCWLLRRNRVHNFWPYVIAGGALSWSALFLGGLHPAIALVPIIPFLPHAARDPGLFTPAPPSARDALSEFEHWWKYPVQAILFLFGLVNAGVPLRAVDTGTWAVLSSVLAGKPLGIGLAMAIATTAGFALPSGLGWKDIVVIGFAAAIGFTVALFFATAAFPAGSVQDQMKMGALLSVSGAIAAVGVAALLRAGRFKASPARRPSR
ncbi:MAG TPA: Na+/H+ antiporter NhaA [Vicinamibacterales bacterium]|nr:Na+/H+ antiporter NhaA [Vicinamibacterales bacterium]